MIYKILLPDEWEAFASAGRFDGSPLDAVAEARRFDEAGSVALEG